MRVPDGTDWLEYMLNVNNPDPHELGVMHHLSLGVPSIQAGYKLALQRGYKGKEKPQIGRDGKWQYNLYDPNFTRGRTDGAENQSRSHAAPPSLNSAAARAGGVSSPAQPGKALLVLVL
jgi:hypothetical protein